METQLPFIAGVALGSCWQGMAQEQMYHEKTIHRWVGAPPVGEDGKEAMCHHGPGGTWYAAAMSSPPCDSCLMGVVGVQGSNCRVPRQDEGVG